MGEAMHMEGQGIQEKSIYLFLVVIVNPRLLFFFLKSLKTEYIFKLTCVSIM